MKNRKLIKNIVFSSITVCLIASSLSVQASELDEFVDFKATTDVASLSFESLTSTKTKQNIEDATFSSESSSNSMSSGSYKRKIDPKSVPETVLKEGVVVTDDDVKADFRYGLTEAQKKMYNGRVCTNYLNNCLKMRIELEKMFDTEVTAQGGSGKLYYAYFAGSTDTSLRSDDMVYTRAFVNSKFDTTVNKNKAALADLAARTFADIDGTESYAHLIPTAVYYDLIDTEVVTAEKAAASKGVYKEGDILCGAKQDVTYAKLSKLRTGFDGYIKEIELGALVGTEYSYMGNINLNYACDRVLTKEIVNKPVAKAMMIDAMISTPYLVHYSAEVADVYNESIANGAFKGVFKDVNKFIAIKNLEEITLAEERAYYLNCIANPSNGLPKDFTLVLFGAKKAGINFTDAQGNSNWYKNITVGEAIDLLNQAARIDE